MISDEVYASDWYTIDDWVKRGASDLSVVRVACVDALAVFSEEHIVEGKPVPQRIVLAVERERGKLRVRLTPEIDGPTP